MNKATTQGFSTQKVIIRLGCLIFSLNVAAYGADSPKSVYLKYHDKFESVEKYEDLKEFLPNEEQQQLEEKATATPSQIAEMLKMRRSFEPNETNVLSESINGQTASLKVHGRFTNVKRMLTGVKPSDNPSKAPVQFVPTEGQQTDGVVAMVLQDGTWRVKQTTWQPVVFHDTKVLSAKGQSVQQSDAARQTTTKFVKGKLFENPFGLIRAKYDDTHLLLDGGEMPGDAVMKNRARVIITFKSPQVFPGTTYKTVAGQPILTASKGTTACPQVYFFEQAGAMPTGQVVTNMDSTYNAYSMVLKFMSPTADGQLPGYIDLVVPQYNGSSKHGSAHVTGFFYAQKSSTKLSDM